MRLTITADGQLPLPQALLDKHGWRPGDELELMDTDEGVRLAAAEELEEPQYETRPHPDTGWPVIYPIGNASMPYMDGEAVDRAREERVEDLVRRFQG